MTGLLQSVTVPLVRRLTLFSLLFSLSSLPILAAAPLPPCAYEDRPAARTGYDEWPYTLLDTLYALPESYEPEDLVSLEDAGVGTPEMRVRAVVMDDLQALLAAAEAADIALEVQSAYRSHSYQESTFAYWVEQDGLDAALKTSARPGHSEHQLGTALDFRSAGGPPAWDLEDWRETPEGEWLAENASSFGFVMSYPAGREATTCYSYEPWHYRYVGREAAAAVTESGFTLREWLWERQ